MAPRLATPADIPFVMAVERIPGHDAYINLWTEEQHAAALAGPDHAYLIATGPDGEPAGFAILSDLRDPHGNICLKRIAMAAPGRGLGAAFLRAVTAWTFGNTAAHRFWLYVVASNDRARHVYRAQNFAEEGILREARLEADGTRTALILMSLLRREWSPETSR
ncbi:N-acetyltransferase [Roseomonas sp. KE2513]|uniref:GNAT family N-acetyltransferase n=1 Tax=Roseomonas sp. KE2513 TaxID=2479202 RepID=UPI0018DF578F|nr:GNAT family protein [Roseomonas sp. KE2513]MBI0534186.1 N-acetyltransferase [Roseomonas sp. KE2513]